MGLYDVTTEIEYILAREVDLETGEITDETLKKLADLEIERDALALDIAAYRKGELSEAEAVKREIEKLTQRMNGHTRRAKRLLEFLEVCLADAGPIEDGRCRIAWKKNPPKAAIPVEDDVPEEYRAYAPVTWKPDRKKILDALKAGAKLGFAVLTQSRRLEVK